MRAYTTLLTVVVLLAASAAHAVPMQLAHQGRLLDADGAPLDGEHTLSFALYDTEKDGAVVWSEDIDALMTGGFYSVVLGADEADNPLDDLVLGGGPLWLELRVDDGAPLEPRHELLSVPYSVMAGTATSLDGGSVDATEVAIDGTVVIDSEGNWTGPTPAVDFTDLTGVPDDADSLAGLSCADGGVAVFDLGSGLWGCGVDAVLGSSDVLAYVGGATLDLGAGSSMAGLTLATVDDLTWGSLDGVPPELGDGFDADTLADLALACADGDRPSWDLLAGAWTCAPEEVGLDRLDTSAASSGQVLTFDGANVAWEDPATTASPPCTLTNLDEPGGYAEVACGASSMFLRTWMSFTQVSVGGGHACGIDSAGSVRCWGSDSNGQAAPPGGTFTQVSAGDEHTCGLDTSGSVQCWGRDDYGQSTPPGGTFTQVSAGFFHTCAIDAGGWVQCWGRNNDGQSTPPVSTFSQVSAASTHTCGIDSSSAIQCWGSDSQGQSTPPAGIFTQVSGGNLHTCGLDAGGFVQCWGYNYYGQTASPGGTFTQVSAGYDNACGVNSSGSMQCWGRNNFGQSTSPAGTFTQVSGGASATCGLRQSIGPVACWGSSYDQSGPP